MLCPGSYAELFDLTQVAQGRIAAKGLQGIEFLARLVFRAFPTALKGLVLYARNDGAGAYATITAQPTRGFTP